MRKWQVIVGSLLTAVVLIGGFWYNFQDATKLLSAISPMGIAFGVVTFMNCHPIARRSANILNIPICVP